MKVEIADLRAKFKKHADTKLPQVSQLNGMHAFMGMLDLKVLFLLKEDFDVIEEKMSNDKYFVKLVGSVF